jgi:hypothetical protein
MAAFSTFTYAKKYFVSDEIEFVTEKDLEFDITYKIPEDLLNIFLDNLDVRENIIVNGRIGIGTTQPQQRLDVAGSVKIDENIYDSVNVPGRNGYQLSRDVNGIRWIPLIVDGASPCCGFGTIVGLSTYSDGIFILDEGVPIYPE